MKSVKSAWSKMLQDSRSGFVSFDYTAKKNFPKAVAEIYEQIKAKKDLLRKSFAITGLHPFSSKAPDYSKLLSEHKSSKFSLIDQGEFAT